MHAITDRRTTQGTFSRVKRELTGWTFTETAGSSSVTIALYDGSDASGTKVVPSIKIPAGSSVGEDYQHPITLSQGNLFVEVSGSGTAEVIVRGG